MTVEYKPASPEIGVVSLASPYTVDDTTERVVRVIERAGMTIFARIDQQGAAQGGGVDDATHDARAVRQPEGRHAVDASVSDVGNRPPAQGTGVGRR